jgi:hypothetical protein
MAPLVAVIFAAVGGWHVGAGPVHRCAGTSVQRCAQVVSFASTVRWRDCPECLPHKTIAALPRNGIALQLRVAVEHPPFAKRTIHWPLAIHASDVSTGFEGISNRYGVYQSAAFRIGRKEVSVWAFFGRAHPTRAQLARANAEIATTSVR